MARFSKAALERIEGDKLMEAQRNMRRDSMMRSAAITDAARQTLERREERAMREYLDARRVFHG